MSRSPSPSAARRVLTFVSCAGDRDRVPAAPHQCLHRRWARGGTEAVFLWWPSVRPSRARWRLAVRATLAQRRRRMSRQCLKRWMDRWERHGWGWVRTRLAQGAWASHACLAADGCTGCTVAIQVQECVGMNPRCGAPRGRCTGETNRNRRQGGQQRSTRGVSEGRGAHALGCLSKSAVSIVEPERGRCCGCRCCC